MEIGKSATKAIVMLLSRKDFLPKKLSAGEGGSGGRGDLKCCDPEKVFLRELCVSSHWRLGPNCVFAGPSCPKILATPLLQSLKRIEKIMKKIIDPYLFFL
jgi:hypothetical protein